MTTNHRPTLESKKGKVAGIKDSIVHARDLSQQKELKYRSKVDYTKGKVAFDDLKRELLLREKGERGSRDHGLDEPCDPGSDHGSRERDLLLEGEPKRKIQKPSQKLSVQNLDTNDLESSDNLDEDSESELLEELRKLKEPNEPQNPVINSSDSDTEDMLAELQTLRKQKTASPIDISPIDKNLCESGEITKTESAKKKDWRSQKVFDKKKSKSGTFTNDTLKSDFHQDFLSHFIK